LPSMSPGAILQAENRAYGHAKTLSEYAGFTSTRWVPGALQHGWNPFDGIGMNDGAWRPLPKFVWADDNVARGIALGGRHYRAIGAPWLYLLRMTDRAVDSTTPPRAQPDPGSTIAFPFHGTVHHKMVGSHSDYARDLADGEGARSLTVCLQWLDADDPATRRAYEDIGATVVTLGRGTSGAPGHDGFLRRQLGLIGRHDRLVSNRLATAVFYGAAAGLQVGIYGTDMSLEGQIRYADSELPGRFPQLHSHTVDAAAADQAWRDQLGDRHVLQPSELRDLMGWTTRSRGLVTNAAFLGRRAADLARLNARRVEGRRHFRVY
jgi:hypothetical protein